MTGQDERWQPRAQTTPPPASVVTIGNFDGVHRGHQAVLGRLVEEARRRGLRSVALTFDPHPLQVLHPDRAPRPLITLPRRLELIRELGVAAPVVMTFTRELAGYSPARFVREVLVEGLGARVVVIGADSRFGHRNAGDVHTMRELGGQLGFEVVVLDDVREEGANGADGAGGGARRWSSTWARELIAAGDVAGAAHVLGRPPRVSGTVVHGDHRGRELGYPTANLSPDAVGVVPADGVYAGHLVMLEDGSSLPAAVSVGTNPTFDGRLRRVESYVLDRTDLDLYGRPVAVDLVARLRPTVRFDGVPALLAQMAEDVDRCRQLLLDSKGPGQRW